MKEEILAKLERLQFIKETCYGLGVPPTTATEFWNDLSNLKNQLSLLTNPQ